MDKLALLLIDFLELQELKKAKVDEGLSPDDKFHARAERALQPNPSTAPKNFIASNWPKKFIADYLKHKAAKEKDIKPNLPKSEILNKPYHSDAQRRWAHTDAGTKALGGEKAVEHWDKESKGLSLPEVAKASVPKLDKQPISEPIPHMAGVPIPPELQQHDGPIPRNHPHRDIAVNFVTDVHRKNKYDGLRASIKYLGIGEGGVVTDPNIGERYGTIEETEKAIGPAQISGPIIRDSTIMTNETKQSVPPTFLNNIVNKSKNDPQKEKLKDIVKHLKNMQKPPLNVPAPNPKDPVLNYDTQGPKPPKR